MVIGITGGIGSGKTTIGRVVELMGYLLYNSDRSASYLMNNDSELISNIKRLFGEESYTSNGLNRAYLASEVFGNSEKLSLLESVVHPAIFSDFEKFVEANKHHKFIFVESAILFESGFNRYCNTTITVSAPEELRIARVAKRDSSNYEAIKSRINAQMSDNEREKLADYVIKCDEHNSVVLSIIELLKSIG